MYHYYFMLYMVVELHRICVVWFSSAVPLQCVPEAANDGGAVRAGDGFPLGAADVMQDVVASLHCHFHPGGSLGRVQWPGGGCQVLDMHVVFP